MSIVAVSRTASLPFQPSLSLARSRFLALPLFLIINQPPLSHPSPPLHPPFPPPTVPVCAVLTGRGNKSRKEPGRVDLKGPSPFLSFFLLFLLFFFSFFQQLFLACSDFAFARGKSVIGGCLLPAASFLRFASSLSRKVPAIVV